MKIKIVADDKIPFLQGVLDPFAKIRYLPGASITSKDLEDVDALLIRTRTKCNEKLLSGTKVKFIGTATIGFDHIDTVWCESNGIHWTNAPGCNSGSVKQYIAAAISHLSREKQFPLKGKVLGIIGVGHVGSKVASLGEALGMRVLLNDPPRARMEGTREFTQLDDLLQTADIVSMHVPLIRTGIDKSFHLADQHFFNKMKKGSWFLNSSRGEVVHTSALFEALEKGIISASAIDVWENEPQVAASWLKSVDIVSPHIAGYSYDGKARGTAMVVQALSRYFQLPLKEWEPGNLTEPTHPFIDLAQITGDEEGLKKAILHTYNIKEDDQRFRDAPENFEKLRGTYPLRREFEAYSIIGISNPDLKKKYEKIGFKIKHSKES